MHAVQLAPTLDTHSARASAQALAAASDFDARRLESLWVGMVEGMGAQLRLDDHLRDAADDFAEALQRLSRADDEADRARAVDDLRHHAAMLEDLLASPVPA